MLLLQKRSDNVSTHYRGYYNDKHLVLTAILDPRFKTERVIRDELVRNQLGEIRNLLVKETEAINVPPAGAFAVPAAPKPALEQNEVPKRPHMFSSSFSSSGPLYNQKQR